MISLTGADIFRFWPGACAGIGQHAKGREENLTLCEYQKTGRNIYG